MRVGLAQTSAGGRAAVRDEKMQSRPARCQLLQRLARHRRIEPREVIDFRAAEDLDPVRMDEVEVADQALGRGLERSRSSSSLPPPSLPATQVELEALAIVLKQLSYADLGHGAPTR